MPRKKRESQKKAPAIEPEVVGPEDESLEVTDLDSDVVDTTASLMPIEENDDEQTEERGSLVRYDPLGIYLREISKFPQLTREDEKQLALRYLKEKDLEAAKQLIQSNLWLVVKIARDYQNAAKNLLDLIQEGNMGLMEAVKNFDPLREVRFPSYASWWIKAYIVRYLIANFRLVKLGTTQAQRKLFFNLKKEREKLEREGFFPAPKLLAEKLNVRESDIIEMEQRLGSPDISVHTPLSDDGDGDLLSVLPNEQLSAEEMLSARELKTELAENLERFEKLLNEKERAIFKERLLAEEKVTLQELSDRFSVSKERIRQIEERVLKKLKEYLSESMGQFVKDGSL